MGISDIQVVQAFREKLKFHNQRQRVLAENIANATTPHYRGKDLKAPDFFRVAVEGGRAEATPPTLTNPAHLPGRASNHGDFRDQKTNGYEVTPDGNAVVLEEQMMKVAENQMDYQIATSLYQRSIGLLKTAIGRR